MKLARRSGNNTPRRQRWLVKIALLAGTAVWLPLSSLWHSGYALTFTAEEISSYAAAVLAMEDMRRETYSEISDLMTSEGLDATRYDLRCLSINALGELPRSVRSNVQREMITFCNEAKQIVLDSGLTIQLFNSMTATHLQDEELTEQIQSEIIRQR